MARKVDLHAIACPSCKRHAITRRDFFYAPVDGTTQCPACGRLSRLDLFSRWIVACMIALVLPSVLLYGNVFYSGHLFLVSMFLIFGAWRALTVIGLPVFVLEAVPDREPIGRRQSVVIAALLLVGAMTIDVFMASRFEPPEGYVDTAAENLKR